MMSMPAEALPAIIDKLKHLVAALDIELSAGQIDETTFLFEGGLGLDSFAVVELVGAIEEAFGIEFPEQDLTPESFHNVRTLAGVIVSNLPTNSDTPGLAGHAA